MAIDADLDARDAERQAAAAVREGEPGGTGEEEIKPWWEDDPRFTSRFKPT